MGKMKKDYTNIENCRVCGSRGIAPILFLGDQPLANSLKKSFDKREKRYPLTLCFCPRCSLVQLKETVKKEILFDNYVWVTGTSESTRKYADVFYERAVKMTKIESGDLVVEIASNDGTFLKPFVRGGCNVIGIEPAKNIAEVSVGAGIKTINKYWNRKISKEIRSNYGKAKIVIARNVMPHVSELHEVVCGMRDCMADDGIGIVEFHYAGNILQELHYDSIYHEHLCYFSIKTMEYLLRRFGLFPFYIDLSPISGGSYVMHFSKRRGKKSLKYRQLVDKEKRLSVNGLSSWKKFSERCMEHRNRSRKILESVKRNRVVAFGASARSSTYLNFCGFTSHDIKAIIDNNPLKQGFNSAGSRIPIVSIEEGLKTDPLLLFILAWNFRDEIVNDCKKRGYEGDYLVPFPGDPYILNGKNRIGGRL